MTSWLTSAELEALRADLERTLPDTCVIQAVTRTADGQGGWTEVWAASGTVSCRMDQNSGNKGRQAAAVQDFATFTLTVPYDTGLTALQRVVHAGETYNVIGVTDTGSWLGVQRAQVARV